MNDNIRKLLVSCGWQITYDEFNIDFSLPFFRQTDRLNEDLLQASSGKFIIDMGWYPEGDPAGKLRALLIKNHNWLEPVSEFEDNNAAMLEEHIRKLISYAERGRSQ
ncbi:MAG: hypothetical protein PUI48_03710 [Oscillospiraceae bacterium]|nr:hypothetical protein [Oscillospiraceae bacterium]MDY6208656.1 hypothetical protein [Oscillospiraceae bacterium]